MIFVPSSMSIVYTAQSSVELEQHAFLPTEGAMKNSQSGGVGGQKGHVDCQAPCSDGLLHQGCSPQSWLSLKTLGVPGSVARDSEGAGVLELLLGILALRMELSLHGDPQAWNTSQRGDDGNVPIFNPVTSCHLS